MMLNNPRRKPLIVERTYITVPVSRAIEVAITEWIADHLPALEEKLSPLGVAPEDLALPEWHRLVYQDEALSFADRMARQSFEAMEQQKAEDRARHESPDQDQQDRSGQ